MTHTQNIKGHLYFNISSSEGSTIAVRRRKKRQKRSKMTLSELDFIDSDMILKHVNSSKMEESAARIVSFLEKSENRVGLMELLLCSNRKLITEHNGKRDMSNG